MLYGGAATLGRNLSKVDLVKWSWFWWSGGFLHITLKQTKPFAPHQKQSRPLAADFGAASHFNYDNHETSRHSPSTVLNSWLPLGRMLRGTNINYFFAGWEKNILDRPRRYAQFLCNIWYLRFTIKGVFKFLFTSKKHDCVISIRGLSSRSDLSLFSSGSEVKFF